MWLIRAATLMLASLGMANGFALHMATSPGEGAMSRREAVSAIAASTTFAGQLMQAAIVRCSRGVTHTCHMDT